MYTRKYQPAYSFRLDGTRQPSLINRGWNRCPFLWPEVWTSGGGSHPRFICEVASVGMPPFVFPHAERATGVCPPPPPPLCVMVSGEWGFTLRLCLPKVPAI